MIDTRRGPRRAGDSRRLRPRPGARRAGARPGDRQRRQRQYRVGRGRLRRQRSSPRPAPRSGLGPDHRRPSAPGRWSGFEPRVWYNPQLRSTLFLVPGLIAYISMITAVISTALAVVREKERGTMEQIRMAPVTPLAFVHRQDRALLGDRVRLGAADHPGQHGALRPAAARLVVAAVPVDRPVPGRRAGPGPAHLDGGAQPAGGVPAGAALAASCPRSSSPASSSRSPACRRWCRRSPTWCRRATSWWRCAAWCSRAPSIAVVLAGPGGAGDLRHRWCSAWPRCGCGGNGGEA